jgi:Mg2+ and Co2+ transporter CorA
MAPSPSGWICAGPDHDDLAVLSEEFGLHPLAVEAALRHSQRPKLDRYRSHLLLTAYGARLDTGTGELTTNLTIQGNRLNVTTKKVTGWAAIIAVPTLITGYFGMNVPYPGFGEKAGFAASIVTIVLTGLVLYFIFKRKDWL